MDADQLRVKAYELALLTFARHPMAIGVDQILPEANKIERWLAAANAQAAQLQGTPMQFHPTNTATPPYSGSVTVAPGASQGWVTVGGAPVQHSDDPPPPAKPIKKADW